MLRHPGGHVHGSGYGREASAFFLDVLAAAKEIIDPLDRAAKQDTAR